MCHVLVSPPPPLYSCDFGSRKFENCKCGGTVETRKDANCGLTTIEGSKVTHRHGPPEPEGANISPPLPLKNLHKHGRNTGNT
jgi:hypothetical protein